MNRRVRPAVPRGDIAKARLVSLPQVETIRVLALGWIFLFHLWSVGLPSPMGHGPLGLVLSLGYLGAFFFNMITGLVLSLPHLGPEARQIPPYMEFLHRRFLRIFPNYFLALLVWGSAAALETGRLEGSLVKSFVSHLLFIHTLSPHAFFDIVPAFWWLGLLAQFYVVFPLVLRLFIRIGGGRTLLLLCAICWGGWMILGRLAMEGPASPWASIDYMVYYNLPVRLPEFVMGMWLAQILNRGQPRPAEARGLMPIGRPISLSLLGLVCWAVVLGAAWAVLPLRAMPLFHFYQVAWCLLIFAALLSWRAVAAVGKTRPFVILARASYSFYLLHQPILKYAAPLLRETQGPIEVLVLVICEALVAFFLSLGLDGLVARLKRV